MKIFALVPLALLPLVGCGEGTRLPPAPHAPVEDTTTTTSDTTSDTPVTPKREVIERDPFGNVATSGNLLWDGDFEWRPAFASQPAWFQGDNISFAGFGSTKQVVGASCKSGVKCTLLEGDDVLLGLAVASDGDDLEVSFWAYPDDGDCLVVEAQLWSQQTQSSSDVIGPASDEPGEDGWCRYVSIVPERHEAQYLFIHNAGLGSVFIDDAVIVPAGAQKNAWTPTRHLGVIDPALSDRIAEVSATIIKPRILPKSKGELAWERHQQRRWRIGKR